MESHVQRVVNVKNHWGNKMPSMTMEELAELIQAINKYDRHHCDDTYYKLVKELADVYISLEAYQMYLANYDIVEKGTAHVNKDVWHKLLDDVNKAVKSKLDKKY